MFPHPPGSAEHPSSSIPSPNFHPFFPRDNPVQLPNIWMRINLLLFPVSWSCCLLCFHLIQLGWMTGFALISLLFCSCQAWRQLWKHIPRAEEVLTSFQNRGWLGKATMSAIFPAKKISQPLPESRGLCGACFVIKIRVCVQLQHYCWQSPSGLSSV